MIDGVVRPYVDRVLEAIVSIQFFQKISPNSLTVFGFILGLISCVFVSQGMFVFALFFLAINRVLDGLDGTVARRYGRVSDFGGYLDIVLDFLVYAGFVLGFAILDSNVSLYACFLIFCYVASGCTFLAYAVVAEKRGCRTEARGRKSFYHVGGLAEGSETIFAMVLMCLIPQYFIWIATIFGCACLITALGRMYQAYVDFGSSIE